MPKTLKSSIWAHILKSIHYRRKKTNYITTKQIKGARDTWRHRPHQFEPRILCKHDTAESRPDVFKKNGLYLLPVSNSEYLLTHSSIYYKLPYPDVPSRQVSRDTSSLLLSIGQSEASLLNNLYYSGIFQEYLNEPITHTLFSSRHRCSFDAKLDDSNIKINGVQYEIDACYETQNKILLIEAKKVKVENFNIRQLYYPYRAIFDKNQNKEIIPLFIAGRGGLIHIWQFRFENAYDLASITCVRYDKLSLN